jgi:hypothetical protein
MLDGDQYEWYLFTNCKILFNQLNFIGLICRTAKYIFKLCNARARNEEKNQQQFTERARQKISSKEEKIASRLCINKDIPQKRQASS